MNHRTHKLFIFGTPMLLLMASTVAMNLHHAALPVTAHMSNATASLATGGVMAGACAIAVSAVGAVVALGVGGATLGFGAALAVAATIEVSAVACGS